LLRIRREVQYLFRDEPQDASWVLYSEKKGMCRILCIDGGEIIEVFKFLNHLIEMGVVTLDGHRG
jgi:hypothetical protein